MYPLELKKKLSRFLMTGFRVIEYSSSKTKGTLNVLEYAIKPRTAMRETLVIFLFAYIKTLSNMP